jgi:prepilin-type N-terminal cleavage/methylation domain-containing protein/prepilin-type processing-associated H-X9-DG protein
MLLVLENVTMGETMERNPALSNRTWRSRPGFTLIELLVVVAILGLLMSILLPSLASARALAKSTVCLSHERSIGLGIAIYTSQYRGFIPGPNTSGYYRLKPGRPPAVPKESTAPITADDWMSPTFGKTLSLSTDKNERLMQLFNNDFRCPANNFNYDSIYPEGTPGWPSPSDVSFNSYSMPITLHYYNDAKHAKANSQPDGRYFGAHDTAVDIRPGFHNFQIDRLNRPGAKVLAMDGARYILDGKTSFNVDEGSAFGGNFTDRGPGLNVFYAGNGSPYKFASEQEYPKLDPMVSKYTYRHPHESINVVFFDGHAANLTNLESRAISLWYPSGSIVLDPSVLGDRSVHVGTIVP